MRPTDLGSVEEQTRRVFGLKFVMGLKFVIGELVED
jgi:hypothetical protein